MQPENAIEVKNIQKSFKVYFDKGSQLKERVLFRSRNRFEERTILKGISFNVKRGEAVGLIGSNGCGKSTTLKLLTKIIYPDSGTIEINGRVSSLIELGAGFHPDMSGRENIYTNAAIFGLTKNEIDDRMDDIIRFSELGEYIDNPVRTFSSGMYMRLAFSVAINVNADILLIDEILAVGDAKFQAKCFNRLREIKAAGTTIVIVSHSTAQIEQICDRAVWIRDGAIAENGVSREVIQNYMSWIMGGDTAGESQKVTLSDKEYHENNKVQGDGEEEISSDGNEILDVSDILKLRSGGEIKEIGNWEVIIKNYAVLDGKTGKPKRSFAIDDSMLLQIAYERKNPSIKEMMCSVAVYRSDGILCYTTNSLIDTGKNLNVKDKGVIRLTFEKLQLMQGDYSLDISLTVDYGPIFHGILNASKLTVYNSRSDYGVFRPNMTWKELDISALA